MSKPLHSVLIIALTIVFVAPEALADGDVIVIQVRTDATPGVQFDSIRSELFTPDMSTLISTADHTPTQQGTTGRAFASPSSSWVRGSIPGPILAVPVYASRAGWSGRFPGEPRLNTDIPTLTPQVFSV